MYNTLISRSLPTPYYFSKQGHTIPTATPIQYPRLRNQPASTGTASCLVTIAVFLRYPPSRSPQRWIDSTRRLHISSPNKYEVPRLNSPTAFFLAKTITKKRKERKKVAVLLPLSLLAARLIPPRSCSSTSHGRHRYYQPCFSPSTDTRPASYQNVSKHLRTYPGQDRVVPP